MFKISLIFKNSERRGDRVQVGDRFLIGRHSKCDLRLESKKVSRRHCVIMREGERVLIHDLGSRNGTRVNGREIKGDDFRLWHRDEIQVGAWTFRVSLRDAATGKSIRPTREIEPDTMESVDLPPADHDESALASGFLDELENLSTHLEISIEEAQSQWSQEAAAAPHATSPPANRPAPPPSSTEAVHLEDEPEDSALPQEDQPATQPTQSPAASESKETGADRQPDQPGKIPAHLRPHGPADSTDAAQQALRRHFRR